MQRAKHRHCGSFTNRERLSRLPRRAASALNHTPARVCGAPLEIASGIGNAILPWSALCDADQQKTLSCRRFTDAKPVRTVSLCFSEVIERTPAMEAVALTLKSLVRELVENGTWQGVSLIEPGPEPEHALVPQ
jgi:hypothetical protein